MKSTHWEGNGSARIFALPTPLRDEPGPPPTVLEAEQTLIGAVLADNKFYAVAAERVTADYFSEASYARAWLEIDRQISLGTIVNPVTLQSDGVTVDHLRRCLDVGMTYVRGPKDVIAVAETVAEASRWRQLHAAALACCSSPLPPTTDVLTVLREQLDQYEEHSRRLDKLPLINGATVVPVPICWAWKGYFARGKLHLLAGAKGTGKTTIAVSLAAAFTTGGKLPDRSQAPLGDVLMWSGEDDLADSILPRLIACGGDPRRFNFVDDVIRDGKRRPFDPSCDMPALIAAAQKLPELVFLIVDPIVSAVAGDSHKNAEVRRGLQPTVDLLRATRAAGLGITHFTKGTAGQDPIDRINASLAFGAVPRVVFGAAKPRDPTTGKRCFLRVASNIGPEGGGFEYDLEQQLLPDFAFTAQHVVWGAQLDGDARTLLSEVEESPEPRKRDQAKDWLLDRLAAGPVLQVDLEAAAKAEGISFRTLRRAKSDNQIVAERDGTTGVWHWRLPRQGGQT
jgi:putative DNA primase/helicase